MYLSEEQALNQLLTQITVIFVNKENVLVQNFHSMENSLLLLLLFCFVSLRMLILTTI